MRATRVCMRLNNTFTRDPRVEREAEALAQAGYDVTVVADMKPGQGLAEHEARNGVRIRRISKSSRLPYWSIIGPLLEERADVYHAHDIDGLLPCLAAARLSRRQTRVVYDSHELWSGHARDKVHRKRRVLVALEGPMLRAADALITASPAYTEEIVGRYRYRGPAHTLLNVPVFRTEEELAPMWIRRRSDARVLVTAVGVFQYGRGGLPLIRALEFLPAHFDVELVGPFPQPAYEAELRNAALPFGDRVRFEGPISPPEVITRMAAADISTVLIEPLSLSYRYTAPNKLFDSMMAGTPIVASDMPVIAQVVRDEAVGEVCDVSSPADIARAILAAVERSAEYASNCRHAAERYNWENERNGFLAFYCSLAQPAHR